METKTSPIIEEQRASLTGQRQKLLNQFTKAAQANKRRQTAEIYGRIREVNAMLESLAETEQRETARHALRRYKVSSLFLQESFKKLTADQDEEFFFVTGTEVEGTFVLDQM